MKKILIIALAAISLLTVRVGAEENAINLPEEYEDIKNFIPEDIFEMLPNDLFSTNEDELTNAVDELTTFDYLARIVVKVLNLEIKSSIDLLFILSAAVILSSLINNLNSQTLNSSGGDISKFISNVLIVSILITTSSDIFSCSKIFFERISLFISGMLPFLCTLSAMGGGISSAVASNYGMTAFLAISEFALSKSLPPIASACVSLASVRAVGDNSASSSLLKGLKKIYVFLIGMLMTLMLFVFSTRGIMAHSADTLGGRAIKFAAGSFIPIVGANIGDILKGVGSGMAYLKNTVGIVSVFIILLMLLPTFISVILRRAVLYLCSALSDLLGASEQSKVINEFASVYGMILAVISMSSVLFIAAVIISVRIGTATI
ncbi:MAG: hypothetical protein IIX97_03535 [Clostridia bacterium]|nr:hypothetical protein [Clostridia bacterium]